MPTFTRPRLPGGWARAGTTANGIVTDITTAVRQAGLPLSGRVPVAYINAALRELYEGFGFLLDGKDSAGGAAGAVTYASVLEELAEQLADGQVGVCTEGVGIAPLTQAWYFDALNMATYPPKAVWAAGDSVFIGGYPNSTTSTVRKVSRQYDAADSDTVIWTQTVAGVTSGTGDSAGILDIVGDDTYVYCLFRNSSGSGGGLAKLTRDSGERVATLYFPTGTTQTPYRIWFNGDVFVGVYTTGDSLVNSIRVWNTSLATLYTLAHSDVCNGIAFSPTHFYMCGDKNGSNVVLRRFLLSDGTADGTYTNADFGDLKSIMWTPGGLYAVGTEDANGDHVYRFDQDLNLVDTASANALAAGTVTECWDVQVDADGLTFWGIGGSSVTWLLRFSLGLESLATAEFDVATAFRMSGDGSAVFVGTNQSGTDGLYRYDLGNGLQTFMRQQREAAGAWYGKMLQPAGS